MGLVHSLSSWAKPLVHAHGRELSSLSLRPPSRLDVAYTIDIGILVEDVPLSTSYDLARVAIDYLEPVARRVPLVVCQLSFPALLH